MSLLYDTNHGGKMDIINITEVKSFEKQLFELMKKIPFIQHPWFQDIINGKLTKEQIIEGEKQHYLRVRLNAEIFGPVVANSAREGDYKTFNIARLNFGEEVCNKRSHSDIMYQLLEAQGIKRDEADKIKPKAGTMAAIAMLTKASSIFTGAELMAMLSLAELQYGGKEGTAAKIYKSLTEKYGFSHREAETFFVHVESDDTHGSTQIHRLLEIVSENPDLAPKLLEAVRYGLIAFNYEWDGHYQAATGKEYFHWCGIE